MAKFKGKGVVIAGLVAGVASFLSKKENREMAMGYLNSAKGKVNENSGMQGLLQKMQQGMSNNDESNSFRKNSQYVRDMNTTISKAAAAGKEEYAEETIIDVAMTAASPADTVLEGNNLVEEGGAQTTINKFNEEQERES